MGGKGRAQDKENKQTLAATPGYTHKKCAYIQMLCTNNDLLMQYAIYIHMFNYE